MEELIPMKEVVAHLYDESDFIQKELITLIEKTDDEGLVKKYNDLLLALERIDASCYRLKELSEMMKKML